MFVDVATQPRPRSRVHAATATERELRAQLGPARRVREQVRDGLAVIAFSAAASALVAVVFTVLVRLAHLR